MSLTTDVSISEDLVSGSPISAGVDSEQVSPAAEADDVSENIPDLSLLQTWATAAYLDDVSSASDSNAIVSIRVTTSDEIQELNKQYRGKDKATNVLSFPMQLPEGIDVRLLGDIALCASVIRQEAKQQSKSENSHWAHMVVHGMLHLQGLDHIKHDEAKEMEQMEINILNQLGFDSPYE
jgi:probable rRNA maturation factor